MNSVPIFHITHIANLESIIDSGGLYSDSELKHRNIGCMEIAYQTLKERRAKTLVPISAKGKLADYVPFYFAERSPMLYAIQSKKTEDFQEGQKEVIYLVSDTETIIQQPLEWCFTDGHAVEATTNFFENIRDFNRIDWQVINSWKWWDTLTDPDRKRRKQAEFLVHRFFPWRLIKTIGVHDKEIAEKTKVLINRAAHHPLIRVEPKWYYEKKVLK